MTVDQSRKLLYVVAALGLLFGIALFGVHSHKYLDEIPSSDFAINRAAAQQMLDGQPLYDRAAARARVEAEAGDAADEAFLGTYSSFIGPPSTALAFTPWARASYHTARTTFRVVEVLCMLAAIVIAGLAVDRRNRLLAWLVGIAALTIFFPVMSTLALGQVDGFVMLALAIGLWASVRERWYVVGAALGVAVVLKISPWIVLRVHRAPRGAALEACRRRRRRRVVVLVVASAIVGGRPHDFVTWVNDVAPTLARRQPQRGEPVVARVAGAPLHRRQRPRRDVDVARCAAVPRRTRRIARRGRAVVVAARTVGTWRSSSAW